MSYLVARMQKMKAGNLVGMGNHNQRLTDNHSNKDIDTERSYLNYDLVNRTDNYKTDIQQFINDNKSSSRAVRKDAVLINEWIITSDRKFFEDLSDEDTKEFFISAKDYFAENFGEKNIIYATVHLDESTPHLHMGIVPFDKDKKLSAKRVFNRETLRDIQENLPKYLQEKGFDIKRGIEGSDRKNLTVPEFKEMKKEQKEIERQIDRRKDELLAYVKDRKVKLSIDNIPAKKEYEKVKVSSGEKFLGLDISKKIDKATGNVIISEKDFKKIQNFNSYVRESEGKLLNLLNTDIYKENEKLKMELEEQKDKNYKDIEDYNRLVREYNHLNEKNVSLNDQIGDLKAFKTIFKDLADDILIKTKNSKLKSNFKLEYDLENKKNRTRGMSR